MLRITLVRPLLFVCGTLLGALACAAAEKKAAAKADPALPEVERALRAEATGDIDRRSQLAATLDQHPDSAVARWQAGYLRLGKQWQSFDALPQETGDAEVVVSQYRQRRAEAPRTYAGQLELANWCHKAGLKDQERAHLLLAVSLAADQDLPALHRRLGDRQFGKQWVSEAQVRDWETAFRRSDTSLKKWSTRLERIARRLEGTKPQRESALAELRSLTDPSVVPAIELVLAGRSEESAGTAVETLTRIEGPEASLALARQAVFSTWPEIRKSATRALRERRFEDFVPALIGVLATPARGEYRVLYDQSRGQLLFSYVMATELENQFQVAALNVASQVIFVRAGRTDGPSQIVATTGSQRQNVDLSRRTDDILYEREQQRDSENDRIDQLNGRVIAVLADVSGAQPTPDAQKWWRWWYDFTDAPPAGTKPVVVVSEDEYAAAPILIPYLSHSCFAAGTPVWTDSGLVAIERLIVGDRVLAKNIETGELTYKPVLLTTVNPPKDLLTLRFQDESIVCTKGHRFWTSGSGWTKARDLAPQTLLHTATGNTSFRSARPGPSEQTYNLVVDDFHTYFVGKAAILCEDLRRTSLTNRVVPGLDRSKAVAEAHK